MIVCVFYILKDIGRTYLKSLMEEGKYETAARFVIKLDYFTVTLCDANMHESGK